MNAALITAVATIIGAMISGIVSLVVSSHQYSKTVALIEYRLTELEKKVDKHNNVVERLYALEAKVNGGNK